MGREIDRIVRSTVAAAKKAEDDKEAQIQASMNQDTMAAGEAHEPFKMATWRSLMVPRGPAAVPETENEMGATTKIEAGDITTHNQSGRKQNLGGTMEGMGSKGSRSTRNNWAAAERRWNEWEQKRNKITLDTWDFRHAAATTQTEWSTSTAASSTSCGIVVAEAGDTTGAKTSMAAGAAGTAKGMSGHNTRVTPDSATETTVTTVHEISQNKLDFQMPEQETQWVDRSDHTMTTIHEISEDKLNCQVPEQERHCVNRSDQFAGPRTHDGGDSKSNQKEMYQQIQRLECGSATSDSAECRKEGVSSKEENDEADHFGWCQWRGSWWIRVEQGLNSR